MKCKVLTTTSTRETQLTGPPYFRQIPHASPLCMRENLSERGLLSQLQHCTAEVSIVTQQGQHRHTTGSASSHNMVSIVTVTQHGQHRHTTGSASSHKVSQHRHTTGSVSIVTQQSQHRHTTGSVSIVTILPGSASLHNMVSIVTQ